MDVTQMGVNEWLLIAGAVAGPVIAVQVQKLVERLREGADRRERVFLNLMATRQARLSPDHVRALNNIDLAFYGTRVLWLFLWRSQKYQAVLDCWGHYRAHLSPPAHERSTQQDAQVRFHTRADELFVNLLESLAAATGYKFNRASLQSGSYSPEAHDFLEQQQAALRAGVISVLAGERAIPMEVRAFPTDPAFLERSVAAQEALAAALANFAAGLAAQRQGAPVDIREGAA